MRMQLLVYFCIIVVDIGISAHNDSKHDSDVKQFVNEEYRLWDHLMNAHNYNPNIRPALAGEPINLTMGMEVQALLDVDEQNGGIKIMAWLRMYWRDPMLAWNTSEYKIDSMHLPSTHLWKPDISVYNAIGDIETLGIQHALVTPSGSVFYIQQVILHFTCNFDLKSFPYDKHDCTLQMASWVYHGQDIALRVDPLHGDDTATSKNIHHNEWVMTLGEVEVEKIMYACCEEDYPNIKFDFNLNRRSSYYNCLFVAPAVFLSILTPVIFLVDHTNKFPLGAGMMVSLTILMEMLDEQIPTAHYNPPIIAQFYVALFCLLSLGLLICIFTSNLANNANLRVNGPPQIIQKIFVNLLGHIVCVRPNDYSMIENPQPTRAINLDGNDADNYGIDTDGGMILPPRSSSSSRLQWRLLAAVIDRIFFILFCVIVAILLFTILIQ